MFVLPSVISSITSRQASVVNKLLFLSKKLQKMAVRIIRPTRCCARRNPYARCGNAWNPLSIFEPRYQDQFEEMMMLRLPSLIRVFEKELGEKNEKKSTDDTKSDVEPFTYDFQLEGFKPDEITVKTVGQKVVVEAKSEEESEKDGLRSLSRKEYHRSLILPEGIDSEKLTSSLRPNGVLQITAPRLALKAPEEKKVNIEIETTKSSDESISKGTKDVATKTDANKSAGSEEIATSLKDQTDE